VSRLGLLDEEKTRFTESRKEISGAPFMMVNDVLFFSYVFLISGVLPLLGRGSLTNVGDVFFCGHLRTNVRNFVHRLVLSSSGEEDNNLLRCIAGSNSQYYLAFLPNMARRFLL
jgi:hypothetical protein